MTSSIRTGKREKSDMTGQWTQVGGHKARCLFSQLQAREKGQTAKLSPQEQWATAFGFVTLKPPFCKSSL